MFKKWFQSKQEELIMSPLNGKVVPITEVPDPTFSEKMLGDGVAIIPTDGKLFSPVDGEVVQLFPTKHAIGIKTKQGLEILIHIGLDTVTMKGEGFKAYVKQGDTVKTGQPLIDFSLDLIEKKASSTITVVVITNFDKVEEMIPEYSEQSIATKTKLMKVILKS